MTTLLMVKGHPKTAEQSFSMKGFDKFLEVYRAIHPDDDVQIIDVFHDDVPEIDDDMMTGWAQLQSGIAFTDLSTAAQAKITRFNELTEQFMAADKIVLANPLWNLMIPTKVKAWIDTTVITGKTLKYAATGAVGLVSGKKLLHIQANGGIYEGNDPASRYVKDIFNFIGLTDFESVYVEGQAYAPQNADVILNDALVKIENIAKTF